MSKCSKINKYDTIYKSYQDPGDLSHHTCFVGLIIMKSGLEMLFSEI